MQLFQPLLRLPSHISLVSASTCRYRHHYPRIMSFPNFQLWPFLHHVLFSIVKLACFILFVQPGSFDLVGTIVYEIDQHPYQSTFHNGTIEVVDSGVFLSMESVFLITLGIALLVLFGLWVNGQIQNLSKVLTTLFFFA